MNSGLIIFGGLFGMIVVLVPLGWINEENEPYMIRFRQRMKQRIEEKRTSMKRPRWLTRAFWLDVERKRRTGQPWRPEYRKKPVERCIRPSQEEK